MRNALAEITELREQELNKAYIESSNSPSSLKMENDMRSWYGPRWPAKKRELLNGKS